MTAAFYLLTFTETGSPMVIGQGTVSMDQSGGFTPGNGQNYTAITAYAADGWVFNYWALQPISISTITPSYYYEATLTVNDDYYLPIANFTAISSTITSAAYPDGSGTVSLNGAASTTGTIGQAISLLAEPAPGYTFSYWTVTATDSNTVVGTYYYITDFSSSVANINAASTSLIIPDFGSEDQFSNPITDMNLTVIANYVQASYSITVIQSASFTITVSPSQAFYTYGDTATITVTPSLGSLFSAWNVSGGLVSGNSGSDTLTIRGNVTLTSFTPCSALRSALQITEHKLGTIDQSLGVVNPNDLIILNARLDGFDVSPYTDTDCDLTGDGYVTSADRVLLNKILNGFTPPL
jgi:hypothetical protein